MGTAHTGHRASMTAHSRSQHTGLVGKDATDWKYTTSVNAPNWRYRGATAVVRFLKLQVSHVQRVRTLGQGIFGAWHILPSISMVDSVTCLRYAECSRALGYIIRNMVARCRLFAAPGARSCLSVRTQPPTATGAPSQTSTIPHHTIYSGTVNQMFRRCAYIYKALTV